MNALHIVPEQRELTEEQRAAVRTVWLNAAEKHVRETMTDGSGTQYADAARHLHATEVTCDEAQRVLETVIAERELPAPPGLVEYIVNEKWKAKDNKVKPVPHPLPANCFVSEYVAYACVRTDAPPEAHEMAAFAILSAMVGPGASISLATTPRGTSLVLWLMYLVNSTVGRKSTVIDIAQDIIREVLGEEAIINWEGSPQGFIQRLQDRDGRAAVFIRDEYSGLIQQMNRGGHMAGLEQIFIRAFDGGVLENIRTRKKNKTTGEKEQDTDRVEHPYLVKLTAATWDSFMERANIDNVLNGFLARFVFVTGEAKPRAIGRTTERMTQERNRLVGVVKEFHERVRCVEVLDPTDAVLAALWELQQHWGELALGDARPSAAKAIAQRLSESVLKVAGLLALDREKNPQRIGNHGDMLDHFSVRIEMEDFDAAAAIGERWIEGSLKVLDALGATVFQKQCDQILDSINQFPNGIQQNALRRRHRGLVQRDFVGAINGLLEQELITYTRSEEKVGRPRLTYFPMPGREK